MSKKSRRHRDVKVRHEHLDPTPIALPVGLDRPPSMAELVQRYVRTALSQHAADSGHETFEEADDFDVDDDPEIRTKYELDEGDLYYGRDERRTTPGEERIGEARRKAEERLRGSGFRLADGSKKSEQPKQPAGGNAGSEPPKKVSSTPGQGS